MENILGESLEILANQCKIFPKKILRNILGEKLLSASI